jgi:hypothetical protein
MRGLRARLIGIALALLLQQASGLAAVAALACGADARRTSAPMPCCSKGDSGHICPIGKRADNAPRCRLTGDCDRSGDRGLGAAMFLLSSPASAVATLPQPLMTVARPAVSEASPLEQTPSPPTQPPKL